MKTSRKRRTATAPDRAIDSLKTVLNLEKIKGRLVNPVLLDGPDRIECLINLARELREGKELGDDEGFSAIAFFLDDIAEKRKETDTELARISRAIDRKEKDYGLGKDEDWPPGEAPDDVEKLRAAYDARSSQIDIDVMREHGEDEMADLFLNDEKTYSFRRWRGWNRLGGLDDEGKNIIKDLFIKRGWADLLPGLDM